MLDALQKEIEGAMQDPAVIAFALLYKAFKPTVLKQLGLSESSQQALPEQVQSPQHQQSYPHTPQAQHTIQVPQMPTEKK